MNRKSFFDTIEKKLLTKVPQRIKAHLKFHNIDNFQTAAKLNKEAIMEIENFARNTLHQILEPDEMVEFYGSHFQKKPKLFVFTLGERMNLDEIQQICEFMCGEENEISDKYDEADCDSNTSNEKQKFPIGHVETKKHFYVRKENENWRRDDYDADCDPNTSNEKLSYSIGQFGSKKNIYERKEIENWRREPSKSEGNNKYIPPNLREGATRIRSDNPNAGRRDDTTAIRITNLSEDTTEQEIENLFEPFGPIHRIFLARDKNTELCKGVGYVRFKWKNDAAKAVEALNGYGHNNSILLCQMV